MGVESGKYGKNVGKRPKKVLLWHQEDQRDAQNTLTLCVSVFCGETVSFLVFTVLCLLFSESCYTKVCDVKWYKTPIYPIKTHNLIIMNTTTYYFYWNNGCGTTSITVINPLLWYFRAALFFARKNILQVEVCKQASRKSCDCELVICSELVIINTRLYSHVESSS